MQDSQWNEYAELFRKGFEGCEFKDELIAKCMGHEDIASVVFYHNQANSLKWMDTKVPALGNKVPSKMLKDKRINSVKEVLMRFPC